jgi:hypothetical protein
MTLELGLVWQNPVQATVQPRVVDLAFCDAQPIVQRRGGYQRSSRVNSLPGAQRRLIVSTAATCDHGTSVPCSSTASSKKRSNCRRLHSCRPAPARAKLPHALQAHSMQQHVRYLRIVRRRFPRRRGPFQWLCSPCGWKIPPSSDSVPAPSCSARPTSTTFSAVGHTACVRFPPATSSCVPCRPSFVGSDAETFLLDLVMTPRPRQEGGSPERL